MAAENAPETCIDVLAAWFGDSGAQRDSMPKMLAKEVWAELMPALQGEASATAQANVDLMFKLSTLLTQLTKRVDDLEKLVKWQDNKTTYRILHVESHLRFLTIMHTDTHAYWSGQLHGLCIPFLHSYPKAKILQGEPSYAAKICERYANFCPIELKCFICKRVGPWCAYRLKDSEVARVEDTAFVHLCAASKCMKKVRNDYGGVDPLQHCSHDELWPQWASRRGTPWQLSENPLSPAVFRICP